MPLSLGDPRHGEIEDVEALVRKVVDDRLRQWGARLKQWDKDDLVSYLIGVCWELSGRYDPAKDRNPNFAAYAARILSLRVADWYRQRFGDTRHAEKPIVLSLDAPAAATSDGAGHSGDRLVDTLSASTGDPAEDRSPDLIGFIERGSGGEPRPHNQVGQSKARRAARGNRSAAARKHVKPRVPGTYRAPQRPPICPSCFTTFEKAFARVNAQRPEVVRLSDEDVRLRAAKRAQAVKFGSEWFCPRCTTLPDGLGKELMLEQAYPNRQARRQGAKLAAKSQTIKRQRERGRAAKATRKG